MRNSGRFAVARSLRLKRLLDIGGMSAFRTTRNGVSLIAALGGTALLNDLPIPDERFDFLSQLKDALLVMHQHGLLQYEVLHRTR